MGMYELKDGDGFEGKEEIEEIAECLYKLKKDVKKIMRHLTEGEEFGERGGYSGGGYGNRGGGYGNRMEDDDEEEYGDRRGVKGTGRYSRYRR